MRLVAKIRLKVKEGTHKTPVKVRVFEIVTIPMCVTLAIELFGSLTNMGRYNNNNGGKHRRTIDHVINSSGIYNPSMVFLGLYERLY